MLGLSQSPIRMRGIAMRGGAPAPIDANFSAVNADGWTATYSSPPTFDPAGSPEYFTVTRDGFDASGSAATLTENLINMARLRQPDPNELTLTTDQVVLSDFIYSGETVSGATNNSTRTPPPPVCMWIKPDRDRATGQSYTAQLAVAHRHARNGRPVASVKFSITDGTSTVEQTVSTMTTVSYTASGLSTPCYQATLDLSTLTDDAELTLDCTVYPWIGDAYQASVDGATYPSQSFTTMKVLNDVTYGTAYAYVDSVSGDNGTAVVSETPATAEASPYATVAAAAAAIQTYNNSNFSRNNASGGVIRLEAGTHTHSSFSSVAIGEIPLEIEAAGGSAAKATTIYQDAGTNTLTSCPDRVLFRNITLKRNAAGNVVFLDTGGTSGDMFAFENCRFDENTNGSWYNAWIYRVGQVWAIDCDTSDSTAIGLFDNFSNVNKQVNLIGTHSPVEDAVYNLCAVYSDYGRYLPTAGPARSTIYIGHSFLSLDLSANAQVLIGEAGIDGVAIVGTVLEDIDGTNQATLNLYADSNTTPQSNVILQNNTIQGQRVNMLYQDTGTVSITKEGTVRHNIFAELNMKSDVFVGNSNTVGNWPAIFKVSWLGNAYTANDNNGDATPGVGHWIGEIAAIDDVYSATPDFTDNASADGTGLGGGDYSLGASTTVPNIAAGTACYPVDLYGTAISNTGTGKAGAVQ